MGDQDARNTRGRQVPAPEIDAERTMVHFAPKVVKSFAKLEAAVRPIECFDRDLLVNLHHHAIGKPMAIHTALTEIALLTRETMGTGDPEAIGALNELIENLMGMQRDSKPITVGPPKTRAR